jgi:hypothetical protein
VVVIGGSGISSSAVFFMAHRRILQKDLIYGGLGAQDFLYHGLNAPQF